MSRQQYTPYRRCDTTIHCVSARSKGLAPLQHAGRTTQHCDNDARVALGLLEAPDLGNEDAVMPTVETPTSRRYSPEEEAAAVRIVACVAPSWASSPGQHSG